MLTRTRDPVDSDIRSYQASLEAGIRLDKAAEDYAEGLMEKGERFDPFGYVNLSDFVSENPTIVAQLADLLHAGKFAEAGQYLAKEARDWIKPVAVEYANDKIDLGDL